MALPDGTPPSPSAPWRAAVLSWLPAAVFLALPLVLVYPGFQPGKVLFGIDIVGGFYHLSGAIGAALAEGHLPIWDSHTRCGAPLLASAQGAVLYPLTWPSAVMSPGLFWTLTVWAHLSLSGFFAFAWLHRGLGMDRTAAFLGALLFMLSGFVTCNIYYGHISRMTSYPWAAAVMWRLERFFRGPSLRRGMLLSFALALMILAGFPQYVYILAFAVLGRLVHFIVADRGGRAGRAAVAAWASAALALAGALAAPQLLPTAEFVGQSQRAAVGNFEFVTSFSMPPSSLLTLVAPQSLGDCRKAPTDSSIFIGVIGVSLGALGALRSGPLRGLWLGQAILGIVLAMGKYTPVFRLFYIAVPGVSLFRVPSRFLLLFLLAAAPLAARGAQRILRGDDSLRRHLGCLAAASAAVLVGIVASVAWSGGSAWAERGLPGTALALLFLIAGLWGLRSGRFPGAAGAVALGLLLVVEMAGFNGAYFSSTPKDDLEWPEPFVRMVKSHPDYPFRIATVTGEQTPVIGMCELAGIDHVGGYDPMMLRRYTELCNAARGKPVTDLIVAMVLARPGPVFDMLGARYWIVPGPRQEPPGWKTIGEFRSAYLYENPRALPRAFLVGRSIVVPSPEKRLQVMAAPAFDARRIVVLETEDGALPSGPEHVEGAVQLAGMAPGRYELRVDCATDALLVLAESYYPGWTAEIDGSPAPLLRANHLLQAVRIPPGRHELRFTYQSRYLRLGFALAVAGLVVPLAAAFLWKRRGSGLGTSRSRDESGGRQQSAVK